MCVPVLIRRDRRTVIQDEKGSSLYDFEYDVNKKHGKIPKQLAPNHHYRNNELEGTGCDPKVMPQERVRVHDELRETISRLAVSRKHYSRDARASRPPVQAGLACFLSFTRDGLA